MKKRKHWTQTPAGKAKLATAVRKGWRNKRRLAVESASQQERTHEPELTAQTYYAYGKVEAVIEGIAGRAGVSPAALAFRVGELLVAKAHG